MIIGIKTASNTTDSSVSSKRPITLPVMRPKNISAIIHGDLFFAAANEPILTSVAPLVAEISQKSSVVSSSRIRSKAHTSELQSRGHFVCRLQLEKTYI